MAESAGCVVVITGASRGLGAGLAEALRARGARLGLCARSEPVLAGAEGVVAERLDVREGEAVEAFAGRVAERLGPIGLWINNAGVLDPIAPLRELTTEAFREHLAVNVLGVFHGTQAYVRHVRGRGEGGGVLVNVSSGAGSSGYAGWTAYCAGKAGVDRLTECVAAEEGEWLRAYSLAPGVIDTAMQERIRGCDPAVFPAVGKFLERKREGRFNTPAAVAEYVWELAFGERRGPVVQRVPGP